MPWRSPLDPAAAEIYADLYDASEVGWPGELDFYRELAAGATARGEGVLEVACGTSRIAIPLAQVGAGSPGSTTRRQCCGSPVRRAARSPMCGGSRPTCAPSPS